MDWLFGNDTGSAGELARDCITILALGVAVLCGLPLLLLLALL